MKEGGGEEGRREREEGLSSGPGQQKYGMNQDWPTEAVRRALNERSLMMRDLERKGFRKLVVACVGFLAYKWLKTRLGGVEKSKGTLTR